MLANRETSHAVMQTTPYTRGRPSSVNPMMTRCGGPGHAMHSAGGGGHTPHTGVTTQASEKWLAAATAAVAATFPRVGRQVPAGNAVMSSTRRYLTRLEYSSPLDGRRWGLYGRGWRNQGERYWLIRILPDFDLCHAFL